MSRLNVDQIYTRTGTGSPAIREMPAFRATLSTDQSFSSAAITVVEFDTVTGEGRFDTNNWFNTTTHRYTPQTAGYYWIGGTLRITGTGIARYGVFVYKNGTNYLQGSLINTTSTNNPSSVSSSTMLYLNGSTDYVELAGYAIATSPTFNFSATPAGGSNVFEGFLVRPD